MSADRMAALRVAATALRGRVAPVEVSLSVPHGPNALEAVACLRWPGVVRIRWRKSGELIACSLPGQPLVFDAACMRDEGPGGLFFQGHAFSFRDQMSALQAGVARLQDRERLPRVLVTVRMQGRDIRAEAVWHWPGVVRLEDRDTRELLAQSVAGNPFELDVDAL